MLPGDDGLGARALPEGAVATPTSSTSRRSRRRRATRCAACCPRRRSRTSASTAPARRYEALLLRMRAHPLPEAQIYAQLMLDELRKVIPSFLVARRPPRPRRRLDRRTSPRPATTPPTSSQRHLRPTSAGAGATRSRCSTGIPTAKTRCSPRSVTRTRDLPEAQLLDRVRRLPADDRVALDARVRRRAHATGATSPAARSSAPAYRFDVLGDYGAFRDLQRHRMLTIEWQQLHAASRLRGAGRRCVDAGLARALRRRDGALGRVCTTRSSNRSPSKPRTRYRSGTACATSCR